MVQLQFILQDFLKEVFYLSFTPCPDGAGFKFWCNKHFKIETIGSSQVIYCKKTSSPVTNKEDMFDTIKQCHQRVGHSRRDKTWDEAHKNYAWIRRESVEFFLQTCPDCSVRVPVKKAKATKPIISLGFLTRVQVDLIDMSSQPDGDYKWILHARDHFSKYSWIFPLTSKRAAEVAEKLTTLFCMFGPPKILQSDNGREFVASVINNITTLWPGLLIIHGSPRRPQTQGCVERGNGDLQTKLGKWLDEHGGTWSAALQFVTHAINTSTSATTKATPYEVVFGQRPRQDFFILQELANQGELLEDEIDPEMFEEDVGQESQREEAVEPVDNPDE